MAYVSTFATPVNNVSTTIALGGYTSGSGSLTLTSGGGGIFPALVAPNYYRVTVIQSGSAYLPSAGSGVYTIFKVTAVTGDVLTIAGTLDGTTDRNYVAGDVVEMRAVAGTFTDIHANINYNLAMNVGLNNLAGAL